MTPRYGSGPAPVAGPGGSYVVVPGDILTRIAFRFGVTVDAIVSTNHMANANMLYIGQVLVIIDEGDRSFGNQGDGDGGRYHRGDDQP